MILHVKIEIAAAPGRNTFSGYGPGWVAVNGRRVAASLVMAGDRLEDDWGVAGIDALTAAHLERLLPWNPEVVLAPLHHARVGVEVMDTAAACRTFNILLAEGRRVVAALIVA
jgi:uncharacterized protein